ncbi:MAG: response regulator [Planctomycetaceae bacterium]|nr:response regulator [Planctomycetaceae bacterium]
MIQPRVLFVDDEAPWLRSVERALRVRHIEWQVEYFQHGEDALQRLNETPFDAIVSDMNMPGMDGATLLAAVKQRHPELVQVVMSGLNDVELKARQAVGSACYLCKTAPIERLIEALDQGLALKGMFYERTFDRLVHSLKALPILPDLDIRLRHDTGSAGDMLISWAEISCPSLGLEFRVLLHQRENATDLMSA